MLSISVGGAFWALVGAAEENDTMRGRGRSSAKRPHVNPNLKDDEAVLHFLITLRLQDVSSRRIGLDI